MQAGQRRAIFQRRDGTVIVISLRKQIKLVKNSEQTRKQKSTTEVWRRDEQVHDLCTELNLHAPHSEDVT